VAPEPVPEVVWDEAPAEGAIIIARVAVAPLPSRGARTPLSSTPRTTTASGATTGEVMEVVLGHPTPYALGDISVGEAQHVLHREGEDLVDERWRLQLWASMLKRTTVSERAAVWAWQHGLDLQVEAIAQCDTDSQRALADAQELYASAEARASIIIKQEEDLVVRVCQINQRAWEVEELEGLLQEWEELDDITLRRELEALSTHETCLNRREADLEQEQKAL
jgi:regulator of protease activity HflC (stomatin/prohibitin superfamily)